jgi:hypothetical protein
MICWWGGSPEPIKGVEQVRLPASREHGLLAVFNRPKRELQLPQCDEVVDGCFLLG